MRTTVALDATKLSGNLPGISGASLTNITHTPADNSVTLAKMAGGTDGQVITYDASGDPVAIGPGTAGQVLTSAGAGVPQTFADAAAGGKVLQCIQTHDITIHSQSLSANTRANITGLNKTITPTASDSNILVSIRWAGELGHNDNHLMSFGVKRDSTDIGLPAASSSRQLGITNVFQGYWNGNASDTPDSAFYEYLDTTRPSGTSAITYHGTVISSGAYTLYTNRTVSDSTGNTNERLASTITLWEIGA